VQQQVRAVRAVLLRGVRVAVRAALLLLWERLGLEGGEYRGAVGHRVRAGGELADAVVSSEKLVETPSF
jgi:hypothetical protein